MPSILCPVCQLGYTPTNIVDHIRRQHKDAVISAKEAAAAGLVACPCGKVAVNAASLKRHQSLSKCSRALAGKAVPVKGGKTILLDGPKVGTKPGRRTPAVRMPASPPPSQEHIQVVIGRSPSPQPKLAKRGGFEMTDMELEEILEAAASSDVPDVEWWPSPPPSQEHIQVVIGRLPSPQPKLAKRRGFEMTDMELEEILEAAASSDVPAVGWLPSPPPSQEHIQLVIGRSPSPKAPGPCVLLAETEIQGVDLVPPVLRPLAVPPEEWDMDDLLELDMDACTATVYPKELLQILGKESMVQLVSFAPSFKDLPFYGNWVYVASSQAYLLVHPLFKERVVRQLRQPPCKCMVYESPHSKALTLGSPMIMTSVLVTALQEAGCQSVRIQAYGMKAQLKDFQDPARHSKHPLRETNQYDIGCTYRTESITMVRSALSTGLHAGQQGKDPYRHYSGALRVGQGYGGVEYKTSTRPDGITKFKAYPVLVHVLKAVAQKAGQAAQPVLIKTCQERVRTLELWKGRVENCPEQDMCGVRFEVSVRAPSLEQAVRAAKESRLLDVSHMLSAEAGRFELTTHSFRKKELLRDVDRLLEAAAKKRILRGNHSKSANALQRRVVVDLYNALGWNLGVKPTPWDRALPWWEASKATLDVEGQLEQFNTLQGCRQG